MQQPTDKLVSELDKVVHQTIAESAARLGPEDARLVYLPSVYDWGRNVSLG